MSTVAELLTQIERRELILPEFQRGFVWSREKVKQYVESIYRDYPTGHFLIWKTYKPQQYRDSTPDWNLHNMLILDGQQRLTALYAVFRGKPPPFFEGAKLDFPLYFNVLTQEFAYWQPAKMRGRPEWIEVTPFLQQGVGNFLDQASLSEEQKAFYIKQLRCLNRLDQMRSYDYAIEIIPKSGDEIETDEIVRIFNLVNSSGMTLSKADLALAHLCASWSDARQSLRSTHRRFADEGFDLTTLKGRELEFWVRCLAAVAVESVLLDSTFYKSDIDTIKDAWPKVVRSAEYLVNLMRTDAYISSASQLTTPYVLLPLIKYVSTRDHSFNSESEKRSFLHWFYAAQMWARYSGSLDTDLQRDLRALTTGDPATELISNITAKVGRVRVEPRDLKGRGRTSPFFSVVYAAFCRLGAIDWFNGMKLYQGHMGGRYAIEVHHIFPTSRLYREGGLNSRDRLDVARANEIANLALLTKEANLKSSDNLPSVYLPRVLQKYPSALGLQCIPEDTRLWQIENYDVFLEERRRLIARAINEFMDNLARSDEQIGARSITDIISEGEGPTVEFKSSLRWDYRSSQLNKALELVAVKTIVGFMNTVGGMLLVGVTDSGQILGVENDYRTLQKGDRDGYALHLNHLISGWVGKERCLSVDVSFHEVDGKDVCMVRVESSPKPAYLQEGNEPRFYIRTGNQTQPLDTRESHEYILEHWPA